MWKILALLVCLNYVNAVPSRILGGTNAAEGEIPYIISLRVNGQHNCGGSIINENHVLTTCHCTVGFEKFTIQYGVVTISPDSKNSIDVEKVFTHEEYNPSQSYANDVAILRLISSIPIDNVNVKPVTLPGQGETAPDGKWSVLAGWGAEYSFGPAIEHLQRVDLLVYSPADCQAVFEDSVDERYHICAGVPEGSKGQCTGDSGGPLVAEGKQVGVVSWSRKPCGRVGYPGVLARVASYHDWILSKLGSN